MIAFFGRLLSFLSTGCAIGVNGTTRECPINGTLVRLTIDGEQFTNMTLVCACLFISCQNSVFVVMIQGVNVTIGSNPPMPCLNLVMTIPHLQVRCDLPQGAGINHNLQYCVDSICGTKFGAVSYARYEQTAFETCLHVYVNVNLSALVCDCTGRVFYLAL